MGWFAGRDENEEGRDNPYMWQPVLCNDEDAFIIFSVPSWFRSKEDCEDFIRREVIPNATNMDNDTIKGEVVKT